MAYSFDIFNHVVLNTGPKYYVVFVEPVLTTYVVEFVVEATGVAHWISVAIASPQRGRSGLAVCTAGSSSSCCRL